MRRHLLNGYTLLRAVTLCSTLMLNTLLLLLNLPAATFAQSKTAERQYQKGVALLEAKKYDEAIAAFAAALKLAPKHEGAYLKKAEAYYKKISVLRQTGEYELALQIGEAVLASGLKSNDLSSRSKIWIELSSVYFQLSNYPQAMEGAQKALEYSRKIGSKTLIADALNSLGNIYRAIGEYGKAIDQLGQALEIHRTLSDSVGLGIAYGNLGDVYAQQGDYEQALFNLKKALDFSRAAKTRRNEAATLGAISIVYAYQGDYDQSFAYGKKALRIYRELGDKSGESNELANIGMNHLELGNYWQGLQYLEQSLAIAVELKEKYQQLSCLSAMGDAYHFLGDHSNALPYLQRAQQMAHEIGDVSSEAAAIGSIGAIQLELDQMGPALESLEKAKLIFENIGDKRGQAIYSANIGALHTLTDDYAKALPYFDIALQLHREIENPYGVAETYNGLGALHLKEGDAVKSRAAHEQALALGKQLHAQKLIWEAQYGLAQAAQREGKLAEARQTYSEAIATVEAVRGRLVSAEQKAYFLSSRDEIYKGLLHTLYRMHRQQPSAGYDLEAFYYSEKAKARALLDLLAEAKVQPDLPTNLQTQQNAALQKIAGIQTQLQQDAPSDSVRAALLLELEQAEKALQDVIIEIKQKNPAYAQLEYPEAVQLPDFRKRILDDNELVLAFALGEESSYLWAITAEQHLFLPLPPTAVIEKAVKSYVALIDTATRISVPHQARGRELFDLLLKPAGDLVTRAQKIIIIADGVLHNLPFEALLLPNADAKPKYLIEHAEIVYAPSATVLSFLHANQRARTSSQSRTLLAFADPIFEAHEVVKNENGARGVGDSLAADSLAETSLLRGWYEHLGLKFQRLPFTAAEMDSIAQFFQPNARKIYRREQALEERLKREDLKRYAFMHFATHGVLDERYPGRSSLVLTLDDEPSEDGFVQINEIFNLKLDAELVVLSACATATGKRLPGEGLLGMSRAFLYAGAESVLGSLWSVSDKSTARLMASFYRHLRKGNSRGRALQLAKRDLLQSAPYRHPYYWSAFVLMGSER